MRHTPLAFLFLLTVLVAANTPAAAQVSSPDSREAVLAKADRFKATPAAAAASMDRFANATDPFHRSEGATSVMDVPALTAVKANPPRSDKEVLAEIGNLLRPTGVLEFGDKTLLVINERRVPVGQHLSIKLKGETYKVQVVKANAKGFMLRLNDEIISKRIQ